MGAKNLTEELSQLGLSEQTCEAVCQICEDLRRFERNDKRKIKTTKQRAMSLKAIAAKAHELRQALDALETVDWLWLENALIAENTGPEPVPPASEPASGLGRHVIFMEHMTAALAEAADAAALLTAEGKKIDDLGGRKPTLNAYASYIEALAVALKPEEIKPARQGRFYQICLLVFEAAGVPATPEGAVRRYLEVMRKS